MSASSKGTAGAVNRAGSQFGSLGHPLAGDSDSLLVVLKSIRLSRNAGALRWRCYTPGESPPMAWTASTFDFARGRRRWTR